MTTRIPLVFSASIVAIVLTILAPSIQVHSVIAADSPAATPIAIPGGQGGVGFDDLGYSSTMHRVIVPAGRTGRVALIDPDTLKIELIHGFTKGAAGSHDESVTSADVGKGFMLATDHSAQQLDVVDLASKKISSSTKLGSEPDYVRYVESTGEAWVTQPGDSRIEIFSLAHGSTAKPAHAGFIEVPGGPESLVIDNASARAYANLTDATVAIDLKSRGVVARWPNGCAKARGLALDTVHGFLLVGCKEGKLSVLDLKTGKHLGDASSGSGVDIVAYNPGLGHAYLPGAASASMATIGISASGSAQVLGTVTTARHAHCVVADDHGGVYVCDPAEGRILMFKDSIPASK